MSDSLQGRWPRTCPLAAGTAGHSWAHSASVGPAAPSHRARAEWQGRCVGPWCSRAPGGPARGPPVLGALSHRQTGRLVTGRVGGRLTLGSCPPGTFPRMACPPTRVSHVSPVISVTAAGQGWRVGGAWAPGWEPSTRPGALESQLCPVSRAELQSHPLGSPTPTVRKIQLGASVNPQNALPPQRPECKLGKGWPGRVPVSLLFPGTHLNTTVNFPMGLFSSFSIFSLLLITV